MERLGDSFAGGFLGCDGLWSACSVALGRVREARRPELDPPRSPMGRSVDVGGRVESVRGVVAPPGLAGRIRGATPSSGERGTWSRAPQPLHRQTPPRKPSSS